MKKITEEKGITLLSLAVTIIIMLILIGVTLKAVVGDHGVIKEAKTTVEDYEKAQEDEQNSLDKIRNAIAKNKRNKNDSDDDGKYDIVFNANGGTFQNGKSTNKVQTSWMKQNVTKYSHTVNIDDDGTVIGNYPEGQENTTEKRNVGTYTNQAFYVNTDTVTIPDAESLNITITYGTEEVDSDGWGDYVEIIDTEGNIIEKLSGGTTSHITKTYTVNGDTVSFKFTSDPAVAYYGYYAIVTGETYANSVVDGEILDPTRQNRSFLGWYTDQELENKYDECNKLNSNITLYAKWDSIIGKYVKYEPDESTYSSELLGENYTGSDSNSNEFTTEQYTGGWRILDYDEDTGEMTIIMAQPTKELWLYERGYNNGVDVLNDMCAKLFSKKTNGWNVEARSIMIEDIENRFNTTGIAARNEYSGNVQYNHTKDYDDSNKSSTWYTNRKYPKLYAKEIGAGTTGTGIVNQTGLGWSERNPNVSYNPDDEQYAEAPTKLTVTQTNYKLNWDVSYFKEKDYLKLFNNVSKDYWIASRCVSTTSVEAFFGIRYANSSSVGGFNFCDSFGGSAYGTCKGIRAVVNLGSGIKITGNEKGASAETAVTISK